eukprot:Em0018g130a
MARSTFPVSAFIDGLALFQVKSCLTSVVFVNDPHGLRRTALGYSSSCMALFCVERSTHFVATPEVNPSTPSPDPNVQPSRWPSPNKGASSAYIVASAKDGKYREVASLHVPQGRSTDK